MKNHIALILGFGMVASAVQAEIVQVFGIGELIATPTDLGAGGATSLYGHQCGCNEAQGVLLTEDLAVDGGELIPAGTWVDSHLIFQNLPGGSSSYARATWKFDGKVLGTMSDPNGFLEAQSTGFLGAPGAYYPASFPIRGLEAAAGDYISVRGNHVMVVSMVNWMGDSGDWVRVITRSKDGDGDGVIDALDSFPISDTRDTVFVLGTDTGIPNDIVLVAPDGSPLDGVLLADIVNGILAEAKVAAEAKYEEKHGDHDHDEKHKAKHLYKEFFKLAKKALEVWEKADIISKDEEKVIEEILKDSPLYRENLEGGETVMVLGIDTGIANDQVLVAPDGSNLTGVYLGDVVDTILDEAMAAAEAAYEEKHGDEDRDADHRAEHVHKEFVELVKKDLEVWEKAHIILKDESKVIVEILKDAAP